MIGELILGLGFAAIGKELVDQKRREEENERRRKTPCKFKENLTEQQFREIAIRHAKGVKRLWVDVEGPIIHGTVKSASGISRWSFSVDFNNWGKIDGEYWVESNNDDSSIPWSYARMVAEEIRNVLIKEKTKKKGLFGR